MPLAAAVNPQQPNWSMSARYAVRKLELIRDGRRGSARF
jgi:hypothetical protein